MEHSACFLSSSGKMELPEAMHSHVRMAMREHLKEVPVSPDSTLGAAVAGHNAAAGYTSGSTNMTNLYANTKRKSKPKRGSGIASTLSQGALLEPESEPEHIIMVNADAVLSEVVQVACERSAFVEQRLRQIYVEGDDNGDGVLSFAEFTAIVGKVQYPYCTVRHF